MNCLQIHIFAKTMGVISVAARGANWMAAPNEKKLVSEKRPNLQSNRYVGR